ncbi:hypothetical protein L9F63_005353, partial [Diploptera punctata]
FFEFNVTFIVFPVDVCTMSPMVVYLVFLSTIILIRGHGSKMNEISSVLNILICHLFLLFLSIFHQKIILWIN